MTPLSLDPPRQNEPNEQVRSVHNERITEATLSSGLRENRGVLEHVAKSRTDPLHDPMTGLPNTTLFSDRIAQAMTQARRRHWRFAVMLIDLDHFSVVNDTHGRDAGDEVLQRMGQRLQAVTRSDDTVCRGSSDDYLFLMLEAREAQIIEAVAAKLVSAMKVPCPVNGTDVHVTASIGIAVFPDDAHTVAELLEKADAAMHGARRGGRGFLFWSQLSL
jgi:diguanylate cyclase (GGDEF)-like protein